MRLTDDQIRSVLARAEEISSSKNSRAMNAEMEAVIEAGVAVGLPRSAVEIALREELNLPSHRPDKGDLVFAKSADERYYVAEVVTSGDDEFNVRFLRGGETIASMEDLRPCRFLPGEKVVVNWPWWGEWTGVVEAYDAEKGEVEVNDGWDSTETFPIAEVWLARRKTPGSLSGGAKMQVYMMRAAGIGATSVITALLTWLVLR